MFTHSSYEGSLHIVNMSVNVSHSCSKKINKLYIDGSTIVETFYVTIEKFLSLFLQNL